MVANTGEKRQIHRALVMEITKMTCATLGGECSNQNMHRMYKTESTYARITVRYGNCKSSNEMRSVTTLNEIYC